jgi:membrane associated rhomboid family serine protease
MAILYWFGTILSDFISEKKVVNLYLLGGIAGGVAYLLISNSISYFILKGPALLNGASASIYALVVAAATIRPDYKVSLFFFGMISIKYIALFYVVWSFIETTGGNAGGNIAHLGGAMMGYFYGLNYRKKWVVYRNEKPKVKTFVGSFTNDYPIMLERDEEEIEEDELNEILDKISKSGYDSLNKIEKRRLFKASQKNK